MTRRRIHEPGTAPTGPQRRAAADAKLRDAGGSIRTVRLSPEATQALAALRERLGMQSDSAVLERLLSDAGGRAGDPARLMAPAQ